MTAGGGHLGEMLRSARERRGIDREQAARDTRIPERHLAALEHGEYDALPAGVYARGFVRTYARYLGVDPDTAVALYRLDGGMARQREASRSVRRITQPTPRALALDSGILVAAALTLLVGGIAAYLAYQVVTFARTPELRVTEPPGDVLGHGARSITIRGFTEPSARVSTSGLAENPSVTAAADGSFVLRLELMPGANLVTIEAFDPRTSRAARPVMRRIEVVIGADGGESGGREGGARSTRSAWQETLPSTS